jgi:hypothetical protein
MLFSTVCERSTISVVFCLISDDGGRIAASSERLLGSLGNPAPTVHRHSKLQA